MTSQALTLLQSIRWRRATAAVFALLFAAKGPALVNAQESWEFSPYDMRVWISLQPSPRLSAATLEKLQQTLPREARLAAGVTWKVSAVRTPKFLHTEVLRSLDRIDVEQIFPYIDPRKVRAEARKAAEKRKKQAAEKKAAGAAEGSSPPAAGSGEGKSESKPAAADPSSEAKAAAEGGNTSSPPAEPTGEGNAATDADAAGSPTPEVDAAAAAAAAEEKQLASLRSDLRMADKLYLMSIHDERTGFRIRVRELDIHMRTWGRVEERFVRQPRQLFRAAFAALHRAFLPIVRIESVDGKDAIARLRAAGLIYGQSPCFIPEGSALQPVIRRNNRLGEPLKMGILVSPWTLCRVVRHEGYRMYLRIDSGRKNAVGGRNSIRMKRYAILVRAHGDTTRIVLRARSDTRIPLVGYDLYSKDPLTEETEYLGKTDWRGSFEVKANASPYRIVYVRSGGRLMARLPVRPGSDPELVAEVTNDEKRLEAEAYIKSVESVLMDQVVQRTLLAKYIRDRIKAGKLKEAEDLLGRFQNLAKRTELQEQMQIRKGEINEQNSRSKARIDRMFARTNELINENLDPATLLSLQAELQKAQGASSGGGE